MSERIYSKSEPGVLTHIICRKTDVLRVPDKRADLVPEDQFLQVASLRLSLGDTFEAHKHIPNERTIGTTQEAWIVIDGHVCAYLYDLDGKLLQEVMLVPGDCLITLRGGHNYKATTDEVLVYEFKSGPYLGRERDKVVLPKPEPPSADEVYDERLEAAKEKMEADAASRQIMKEYNAAMASRP